MKNRIGVIILILACLALAVALVVIKKQATNQQHHAAEAIGTLSNKWVETQGALDEKSRLVSMYESDLKDQKRAFGDLTNNFLQVSANLTQTSTTLSKTEETLKAREAELKKQEGRIAELEKQNQGLDKRSKDLSASIASLNTQIAETQRKLAASEGDRTFLEQELKRLTTEKTELERQFADVTVLRSQVVKLKDELSIAHRIDWIRRSLFAGVEDNSGQKLLTSLTQEQEPAQVPGKHYDLNVEVSSSGSVRVIPPSTNSPAATNPPGK